MRIKWQNTFLTFLFLVISLLSFGQDIDRVATISETPDSPLVTIRKMVVTGNHVTKERIVFREINLLKGKSYPMPFILQSIKIGKLNLINTAMFVDATVDFSNWFNDSLDIVIDVKERWYWFPFPLFKPIDRNWNVWINDHHANLSRVNYGLKLLGNNPTGRNDKLSVYLVNGYTKQIALTYQNPYMGKSLKKGYSVEFSYSKNREINYITEDNEQIFYKNNDGFVRSRLVIGGGLSFRNASTERQSLKINFVFETISDSIAKLNPNYFGDGKTQAIFPELSYRYQFLNVDYIPYPLKGFKWEFNFTKRGIGGPVELWLFNVKGGKYWPLPKKFYYALNGEFTLKLPFKQPFYNIPLMGYGDNYLRGLEYFVIDGVGSALIKNTLRKHIVDLNWHTGLKSRTYGTIPFKFFLKTYGDLGYIHNKFNTNGNTLSNRFLYTGGFGIDIVTIYDVVFKLEYSFNQLHQSSWFLHLNEN